jgi:hypothetical protein
MNYTRALAVKEPTDDGRVWFVASTEGVKRDGLDLKSADWATEDYERYPIVLYAHDYLGRNLPLGRGEPRMVGKELRIGVEFDQDDDFAMKVKSKALKGLIAGSVGWEDVDVEGKTRHNLMEFSMVPVPADPRALPIRQARALRSLADAIEGIDMDDPQPVTPAAESEAASPAAEVEPVWEEVAAAMVRCFCPAGDDTDDARLERYKALLPRYRRLGRTAPEFLDGATLSALGPAERRGLFLANEPDVMPEAFTEPEPEPSEDGDDDEELRRALADFETRLAALEQRASPAIDETLQDILERLESIT